jgi:excinuclease ABC subunit B
MYADTITDSMQQAIDETNRRRAIQMEYNQANGITPQTVGKSKEAIMEQTRVADAKKTDKPKKYYVENEDKAAALAAEPIIAYMDETALEKLVAQTQKMMEKAARELDFMEAARLRDELAALKAKLEGMRANAK